MQRTILLVEDEKNMLKVTRMTLEEAGYRVLTASSGEEAIPLLADPDLDVVLSDLKMPGMGGEAFIAHARHERAEVPVIVLTAFGSIRSAIDCIRAGASDYLTKPFEPEELLLAVETAVRLHDLMQEHRQFSEAMRSARRHDRLIGDSSAMLRLREEIETVAPYRTNVLITGESGTGKEAVARTIHERGPRAEKPWVAVNCAAVPRDLLESELFGYVRGAFTGATQARLGRFEQASGGTLFLDEIGDLDLPLQGKLLRVLQEREFSPVGSDAVRRVDVRVISATNRDLREQVAAGRFREDLLYRLDVYNIRVPPLRERGEDIPALARHFLTELRAEMDKPVHDFEPRTLAALRGHDWPGNVRELRNAVERALLSSRGPLIAVEDLPERARGGAALRMAGADAGAATAAAIPEEGLEAWLEACERRALLAALAASGGVQAQAARRLGITERSLWHRVRKLGIRIERGVKE